MAGHLSPRGRPPTTPAARSPHRACRPRGQCWAPTPTHPHPQHVGGGPQQPVQWAGSRGRDSAPDLRHPSQWRKAPPLGTPFRRPHSEQCRPARAHAVGPVLGPHARTDRTRDTRVPEPWLPAPEDGRPGEGQRLTPGAPHNGGRPAPPGTDPTSPAACSPHRACRPRGQCWAPTPTHPRPQHVGRGPQQPVQWAGSRGRDSAPDLRRPSQWRKAPPLGTPFRHPHSEQCRPARAHAVGPVLGPHARTDRTRDTRVAEPWLPAPEDGRPGEGQRLTPGAPHNGGRPAPPGTDPTSPAACSPHRACRPRGQCWAPTPTHPRPQHVGGGPQQPAQWGGSRGGEGAWPQTPPTMVEGSPPGDALPPPPQRATPARKGARCGAGAGSPRPHQPHPRHTGRGTLAARSRGRAAGGGTAPDTRRPSQRWQATPPAARSPHRACRPRGQCWAPTPTHPHQQHPGGKPQQPAQWADSRGRDSA